MFKERLATKILLPIFTVIMSFCLLAAIPLGCLRYVFANPAVIIDTVINDDVIDGITDIVMDELDENEILDILDNNDLDIDFDSDEFLEVVYNKDFVKFAVNEMIEAALLGDKDYDEDKLEDWIDEIEDYLEDCGVDKKLMKEYDDKIIDSFEDTLDEMAEESEDLSDEFESAFGTEFLMIINRNLFVSCCSVLIMLVVLFIVAKNKILPIKYFGIALSIADACLLTAAAFINYIFIGGIASSEYDQLIESMLRTFFNYCYIVLGVILVIGVLCIVFGSVFAYLYVKSVNEQTDNDVGYDGNNSSDGSNNSVYF